MRAAHSVYQPNKIVLGNGDDVEVLADGQRDAAPKHLAVRPPGPTNSAGVLQWCRSDAAEGL